MMCCKRAELCFCTCVNVFLSFFYLLVILAGGTFLASVAMDMDLFSNQCLLMNIDNSSSHELPFPLGESACSTLLVYGVETTAVGLVFVILGFFCALNRYTWFVIIQLIIGVVEMAVSMLMAVMMTTNIAFFCHNIEDNTGISSCSGAAVEIDRLASHGFAKYEQLLLQHKIMAGVSSWVAFVTWLALLITLTLRLVIVLHRNRVQRCKEVVEEVLKNHHDVWVNNEQLRAALLYPVCPEINPDAVCSDIEPLIVL